MPAKYKPTSHENIRHNRIDDLGYDWSRVADPSLQPKYPRKIYLPQTTEDIVEAINETRQLGQRLRIRSKGHSSNDLVLEEHGATLWTEKLNQILRLDCAAMTVTVQSGIILADLDSYLARRGYGLPVIGDHDDITAGGFASVGGIGPASHRYGLFIDNIEQFEYVNWQGERRICSKTNNRDEFYRVLAGTGQFGVIATLTLNILRVDKYRTVLANERYLCRNIDQFIDLSARLLNQPGGVAMERAYWFTFKTFRVGQLSLYRKTPQTSAKRIQNRLWFGYLHGLGYWAGRLPRLVDEMVKYLGVAGLILSPPYASIKNVERFSDTVIDSSVGDPTRMLVVLVPIEQYPQLFRALHSLCVEFRDRYRCFTVLSFAVKGVRSAYLSHGEPARLFCELIMYLSIDRHGMDDQVLDELVSKIDDLCIAHSAYRYMHSKTVKDAERRQKIDPNAAYAGATVE